MLSELTQNPSDNENRRWFTDEYFDLIVWTDGDFVRGFQLCYDKQGRERAITWKRDNGFSHERVDSGERSPEKNRSPILVPDGHCPIQKVLNQFRDRSSGIDAEICSLVMNRLHEYEDQQKDRSIP